MLVASAVLLFISGTGSGETGAYGPPSPPPARTVADPCKSQDSRDIVVCAQRKQGLRLDPDVSDAQRAAEHARRVATAPTPAAQASCSRLPQGCGTGLEGLDLASVALVVATTAVKAAKGEDWTKVLKPGGPDEYQLYLQAKQEREAREQEARDAASIKAVRTRP